MSTRTRAPRRKATVVNTCDPEITDAIVCAVAGDTTEYMHTSITSHEQRSVIMQHAKNLDRDGKIALGMILIENGQAHTMKEIHQGVSFLLDNIPDHVIESMYTFVKHRLRI
jgi:hypothetical protein